MIQLPCQNCEQSNPRPPLTEGDRPRGRGQILQTLDKALGPQPRTAEQRLPGKRGPCHSSWPLQVGPGPWQMWASSVGFPPGASGFPNHSDQCGFQSMPELAAAEPALGSPDLQDGACGCDR